VSIAISLYQLQLSEEEIKIGNRINCTILIPPMLITLKAPDNTPRISDITK
jgi:hypothetical protein